MKPSPEDMPTVDVSRPPSAASQTGPLQDANASPRGERNGRFVVLEELGAGAMGVVYGAYDPVLRREVALKLLRSDRLAPEFETSILREAQAMAQLSHANVVSIYDVAVTPEGIRIAMERITGGTLRTWLGERKRRWQEIVGAFREAGAGLDAAHRVGLVHRDFKPTNVLVSSKGEIKVTDFGLAKTTFDPTRTDTHRARRPGETSHTDDARVTSSSIAGTPRYMAPEQHDAAPVDGRTDQFAFCVALWEALCGAPPYGAPTEAELSQAKGSGPPPWPSHARVPRRIAEAVRRGLAAAPEDRFPSMRALLDALSLEDARTRRHRAAMLATPIVLLTTVGIMQWRTDRALRCTGARERIAEVWGPAQQARVREAMANTKLPYAAQVQAMLARTLDDYTQSWSAAHREACESAAAGEQSETILDLRMGCLQRAAVDLRSTVGVLERADATVVERVPNLLAALPILARCDDIEALSAEIPPPADPATARKVEAANEQLAAAKAYEKAAKYDAALEHVVAADTVMQGVEYAPVQAQLELVRGMVQELGGHPNEAKEAYAVALELAVRAGTTEPGNTAARRLGLLIADVDGSFEEGLRLVEIAGAFAPDASLLEAYVHNDRGVLLEDLRQTERASREFREAIRLAQSLPDPDQHLVLVARNGLATSLSERDRYEEAREELSRNLEGWTKLLGAEHPKVAMTQVNMGASYLAQGHFDEAKRRFRIAIDIYEKAFGPRHLEVAHATHALGIALMLSGNHSEAELEMRKALEIREELLGSDTLIVIESRSTLVYALLPQKRYDEAEAALTKAIDSASRMPSFDTIEMASLRSTRGKVLEHQERHAEAQAEYEASLALIATRDVAHTIELPTAAEGLARVLVAQGRPRRARDALHMAIEHIERTRGPAHHIAGPAYYELARVHVALGDRRAARDAAETSWKALDGRGVPGTLGACGFLLAQLLWDTPAQRPRARQLAATAVEFLREAGVARTQTLREAERWLAARR